MRTRHADEGEGWRAEAEHWRAEAERLRGEVERLAAENADLRSQVAALSEKVATLARLVFGTSSEKKKPAPSRADGTGDAEGSERRRRGQRPGSAGHGRRDYSHLETVEEVHDVPEDERVCPDCGAAYAPFGEERAAQIDWRVRLVRVICRRPT